MLMKIYCCERRTYSRTGRLLESTQFFSHSPIEPGRINFPEGSFTELDGDVVGSDVTMGLCTACLQRVTFQTEVVATRTNEPHEWRFTMRDLDDTPHLCKGRNLPV